MQTLRRCGFAALVGSALAGSPPALAQSYGSATGTMRPSSRGTRSRFGSPSNPSPFVLPAGSVLWVQLQTPFILAKAGPGQHLEANILTVNPLQQTVGSTPNANLPIHGNVSPGLPPDCRVRGEVMEVKEIAAPGGKTRRSAVVVFNELVMSDGTTRPFLGGMSNTADAPLPGWLDKRRYDVKDKASSAESMAVVLPWAADLGPIGIGLAVLATRAYQNSKMKREELKAAGLMAMTSVDGDLLPTRDPKDGKLSKPEFYVVSTLDAAY